MLEKKHNKDSIHAIDKTETCMPRMNTQYVEKRMNNRADVACMVQFQFDVIINLEFF